MRVRTPNALRVVVPLTALPPAFSIREWLSPPARFCGHLLVLLRRHHHKFATLVKMSMGKPSSPIPRSAAMGPGTVGGTYAISCCSRAWPVACALWLPLDYALSRSRCSEQVPVLRRQSRRGRRAQAALQAQALRRAGAPNTAPPARARAVGSARPAPPACVRADVRVHARCAVQLRAFVNQMVADSLDNWGTIKYDQFQELSNGIVP